MISVDNVYRTLQSLANSDVRGNIKPDEFRLLLNDVVNEIIDGYFSELNRVVGRENKGLVGGGLENLPNRIGEQLRYFLKLRTLSYNNNFSYFILPADYRFIDTVIYDKKHTLEICANAKDFQQLVNSSFAYPTDDYPICLHFDDKIKIAPDSITSNVELWYLRKHKPANWTFVVINGVDVFNPSALDFADIDLHPSEENNVVLRCLSRLGLNLKERDLVSSANAKEQQNFTKENAV